MQTIGTVKIRVVSKSESKDVLNNVLTKRIINKRRAPLGGRQRVRREDTMGKVCEIDRRNDSLSV